MAVVPAIKPVIWIGSTKDDLVGFPQEMVGAIGYALFRAQQGNKHTSAKALHGFGGAGVLEVVENDDGDTYRAVYTVRLAGYVFVLHVFQKKSKRGTKTTKADIDLVKARLKRAEDQFAGWMRQQRRKDGNG